MLPQESLGGTVSVGMRSARGVVPVGSPWQSWQVAVVLGRGNPDAWAWHPLQSAPVLCPAYATLFRRIGLPTESVVRRWQTWHGPVLLLLMMPLNVPATTPWASEVNSTVFGPSGRVIPGDAIVSGKR